MIIGRKKEIEILNEKYDSNYSSFIAVYGRRRIGKTYLINEVFGSYITFSINAQYLDRLEKKKHDYKTISKTKSSIHLTFITLNGLQNNQYSKEIQSNLSIDDLFL